MRAEFKNVTGQGKKFRLKNISFPVEDGFITGIVGKNGVGKTTLFHYIVDENAKYTGTILIDGKPLRENHKELMNRIGFISEEQQFLKEKTARENVKLFSVLYDRFSEEKFAEAMTCMGLSQSKTVGKMSRGEFIKFQLAFAMAHDTKLYLLDEATAGMDPVFKKDFFKMLHQIIAVEDTAILMSTHITEEVSIHMDYVVQLSDSSDIDYHTAN